MKIENYDLTLATWRRQDKTMPVTLDAVALYIYKI